MMKPESDENACAVCRVSAKQKCGGCKSVYYCGKEHQKAHWKEHSRKCNRYKMMENEKLGRHYVALRPIEAGEVIIREEQPLVQGPQQDSVPICLECCIPLSRETAKPCPRCGWPLCENCTEHGSECEFTQKYKDTKISISGFGITHPTYQCISVIRALALRDNDPLAYRQFINLSSHCDRTNFGDPREISQFVKRFFNKLDDFSEEEIAHAAGILLINGHEVPITEPSQIAVYNESSYLEHSCKANCAKSFTNSGGVIIHAAVNIGKGEHISICYTDPLWGTANRRHHLLRTKFFECTCTRCSDPTEFGTMFNAVKCTNSHCDGYMLPKTFIASEIPDYCCDKCDSAISSRVIDEMMEDIGKELASLKKNDVETCRVFLKKYSGRLHDNHFYMTDVKLALAQLIGQQEGELPALDEEVINEKILLCNKLNGLMKTIIPSENRVRGLMLFHIFAAVTEFGNRQGKNEVYNIFEEEENQLNISPAFSIEFRNYPETLLHLQESKRLLAESYRLLKYEPDVLLEGKVASKAKLKLNHVEILIEMLERVQ